MDFSAFYGCSSFVAVDRVRCGHAFVRALLRVWGTVPSRPRPLLCDVLPLDGQAVYPLTEFCAPLSSSRCSAGWSAVLRTFIVCGHSRLFGACALSVPWFPCVDCFLSCEEFPSHNNPITFCAKAFASTCSFEKILIPSCIFFNQIHIIKRPHS